MRAKKFPWTREARDYVLSHYQGVGPTEMAQRVREKFGLPASHNNLKAFYAKHRLNSGLTGRYEKGCECWNKGRKMTGDQYVRSAPTMFKAGNVPANKVPVGTVRKRPGCDGYLFRKVGEGRGDWKLEHRCVWEEHHGPIPKGMVITFLDGNRENCDISNLALISMAVNQMKTAKGMVFSDEGLNRAAIAYSELMVEIREKKKKQEEKKKKQEEKKKKQEDKKE